jgi:hypothetical protein
LGCADTGRGASGRRSACWGRGRRRSGGCGLRIVAGHGRDGLCGRGSGPNCHLGSGYLGRWCWAGCCSSRGWWWRVRRRWRGRLWLGRRWGGRFHFRCRRFGRWCFRQQNGLDNLWHLAGDVAGQSCLDGP